MNPPSAKKENAFIKYFKDFKVLKETRKEYWGLQIINMLDCTAYFAMFNIIVLSLSQNYGFNDINAGYVFMIFTSTTTICLFFSGVITDWLGIKRALFLAIFGLLITRVGMVFAAGMPSTTMRDIVVIVSLFLMAPFMAMIQTVFQAANKRFTTKRSRSAGFNLWYLFMNVGAAAGGFAVDIFWLTYKLPRFQIFSLGVVTGILCIVVAIFTIHRTEQLLGEDEEQEEIDQAKKADQQRMGPIQIAVSVAKEPVFWRFTALVTLLLGVRSVFLYLGVLHPKFWTRVIGEDAQIGVLQAFNPILVIIGLILLIPILHRYSVYKMLVYGALITSLSMFIIAIPPFGGYDVAKFTYATTIVFLVFLTIGELIWSPRLQEYTAAIAPQGQEGTYLGLSMIPYFLAKTVISFLSGHMLQRWCPEGIGDKLRAGEVAFVDSPYMMWTILGAVALFGTLIAILLKDWFTKGAAFEKKSKA
jgi:MFS family permease